MRNKGFFWFLTILLAIICVYQLSFTFITNSVENKAEKASNQKVSALFDQAKKAGDSIIALPNGRSVNINDADAREIANAAFLNDTLSKLAEKEVYPVLGTKFKDVKKRSLAFGLDLVGGMSVTLEISIPKLIKSFARNENSAEFKSVYEASTKRYDTEGGDFTTIFAEENTKLNKGAKLTRLFDLASIDGLNNNSTDADVIAFLKGKTDGALDGVEEIMERRINQFGVAQPNIQRDPANNRLYIELPGVQDDETVAEKLQSTANLEFYETYTAAEVQGSVNALFEYSLELDGKSADLDTTKSEDSTDTSGLDTSSDLDLSNDDALDPNKPQGLSKYFTYVQGGGASLGFVKKGERGLVNRYIDAAIEAGKIQDDLKFMWAAESEEFGEKKIQGYSLYMIKIPAEGKAMLDGSGIANAEAGFDTEGGGFMVSLDMTADGSDKWAQMTSDNVNRQVAVTMDDLVFSAPNVDEEINGGRTRISGNFTSEKANDLAGLLNAGALPAPCDIKDLTTVGPTIGADNSRAGLISFGIALALVFVYMIFYYGKAGIVANIALAANILFILGSLASFGAVLTLAGIAGIVLTIGMAVDANVLIFERVREEQTAGKDLKSSIEVGFRKALSSIIDANVTTLLTAIVLKVFGTGPIESFATTLIIGIFTSVFAALVITRLVMTWWMGKGKPINFESKMTKNAFKNFKIDFVGKRKLFYIVSGILLIGGLASIFGKGLNPSVEFSGGRTYTVSFEKSVKEHQDAIGAELDKVFVNEKGEKASTSLKTKGSSFTLEIATNYLLGQDSVDVMVKKKLLAGLKNIEAKTGVAKIDESRSVSPTVSKQLVRSSTLAIVLSMVIIFGYILIRFGKWQYSTGAILAMIHDVTLVLAIFSIFQGILPFNMDVDQAFIAAILTVIGYSINDTVIVFDRIRENLGIYKGSDEKENINKSLNSTLSRTINTSMTTFIVLLVIFLLGGVAIRGFIFALMIGVIVGTYSSVCIATPILIDFSNGLTKRKKKK